MALEIPETPADVSATWLNAAIADWPMLASVTHDDIGEGTGIFGQISRVSLEWSDPSNAGPATAIIKMACLEPENLAIANALGIYERELRFYEEVVDDLAFRTPICHHIQRDEVQRDDANDGSGRFVLVIEDLGGEFVVGDQVVGATQAQAEAIVDALILFHAQWWQHPDLDAMDWIPYPDAPTYKAAVPGIYRAGLPVLQAEWADRISAEAMATAVAVEPKFEELIDRTAAGPVTLIHTDTRLDNIFFAADGSGEIAFIDFQLVMRGRAVADIAYLVGTSVPVGLASRIWQRLLQRWHQGITSAGIEYSWDDCLLHYKEASLYYLSGAMSLVGTFDAGNERGAALVEAYSTRVLEHAADINAAAIL